MIASSADPAATANDDPPPATVTRALVVFATETQLRCVRWICRRFRHCFVVVEQSEDEWIVYDPLSHQTLISVLKGVAEGEIVDWFHEHRLEVVRTCLRAAPASPSLIRPFTCVEAVKRVLGVDGWWIVTPAQLYRHLSDTERGSTKAIDSQQE